MYQACTFLEFLLVMAMLLLWHVGSSAGLPISSFLERKTRGVVHLLMGPALALALSVIKGVPRSVVACFSFLGSIAFEIYLLHFAGERNVPRLGLGGLGSFLAVLLVTVPLAYAAHVFDTWAVRKVSGLAVGRRREVA